MARVNTIQSSIWTSVDRTPTLLLYHEVAKLRMYSIEESLHLGYRKAKLQEERVLLEFAKNPANGLALKPKPYPILG